MKNNNQAIVKKLLNRSLKMNKKRNFFIIMATMLTSFMITSVFSVSMSMVETMRFEFIRLEGTIAHAGLPRPTLEQIDRLSALDYIEMFGTGAYIGTAQNTESMGDIPFNIVYADKNLFELTAPTWTDIVGNYPQHIDEIMVSREALERMGVVDPKVGMEVPISYILWDENEEDNADIYEKTFILSGFYTGYEHLRGSGGGERVLLVSEELSKQHGRTLHEHGLVNILFSDENKVLDYKERLEIDLELTLEQQLGLAVQPIFDISHSEQLVTTIVQVLLVGIFILAGYLLIYNVLYISVLREVRFYGLLKTIGTTPKQIQRIVIGQVMRLCLIGIPIGLLLGGLISFVLVPLVVVNSNIETGVILSFSPLIYIGAGILTMISAFIGTLSPAKKAARITAIEAVKYIGESNIGRTSRLTYGKLYKMAFRNIFRDRKRTAIVLSSLFLGITVFISTTLIVSSLDVEKHAELQVENDFVLTNTYLERAEMKQVFDKHFFEEINSLLGVRSIQTFTQEPVILTYEPIFEPFVAWFLEGQDSKFPPTKDDIIGNFVGPIYGVDKESLIELNQTLDDPIDLEAFERGEFALITTEDSNLFTDLSDIEMNISESTLRIPVGGILPNLFRHTLYSPYGDIIPKILVSNSFLEQVVENPLIANIHIEVDPEYDTAILEALREIIGETFDISIESRVEARQAMEDAARLLYLLGGGLAIILSLISILNLINSMSVGIIVRKREFATLESIGMTRKQLRKMLVFEGLWYGIITLVLVAIIGNGISMGLYKLIEQSWWGDFMTFNYPFIPVVVTALIILIICIIIPELLYRSVNKSTIVERLREAE